MSPTARVLVVFAIVAGLLNGPSVAANSTDHVVINEIHYHPAGDDDGLREFIELHNPGGIEIDLSTTAFTNGISTDLLVGLTIPPGGYLVFARDENTFFETYGFEPDSTYSGKLANSGETVELTRDGVIEDTVAYDDGGDWPSAPDGDGPSLELSDPFSNNNDDKNWHVSAGDPTPRAANSVPEVPTTTIGDVSVDLKPAEAEGIVISASVEGSEEVRLTYRVGFEEPITMAMTEDGDGLFVAEIASQAPGELVRYRIETTEGPSIPEVSADFTYHGFVIPDPTVTTGGAPVFEWFIPEADYQALMADTLNRDLSFAAVLAYDGIVYDNVRVEIRGGTHARRTSPKQSLNFDMPSGVDFVAPEWLDYPIDEFALVSEWADDYFGRAESAWWLFEEAGSPRVHSFGVRLQRNGEFHGAFRFQEKLDGTWRKQTGHDSGEFYKAENAGWQAPNGFDKKTPDDGDMTRPNAVVAGLQAGSVSGRTDFLFDTFNIPALINYAAVVAIIDHDDSDVHNFYAYYDLEGTERWSMIPWDLDGTWGLSIDDCKNIQPTTIECAHDDLMDAIYESPSLGQMFWARVSALVNGVLSTDEIHSLHEEQIAQMGVELGELEKNRWGRDNSFAEPDVISGFHREVQNRRDAYAAESRVPVLGDPTDVVIAEILPDPVDGAAEVLELVNTGSNPIDLSGWTIDAVFKDGATVPSGTILLPGARLVLTDSIPNLHRTYSNLPNVVEVEHNGGLKKGGEKIELITLDGQTADVVDYLGDDTWPELSEEGQSLELIALDLDNSDGNNWAVATRDGGTPGARNSVEEVSEVTVTVLARGTTGEEQARLVINNSTSFDFEVTTSLRPYNFPVEEIVETVRVEFLNDRSRPEDRNLVVDAIEVDGTRYQTEDENVESIGSWSKDNGCGPGNKKTEVLHCNGHFGFVVSSGPSTPPTTVPPTTVPPTTVPSTTVPPTTAPTTTAPSITIPPTVTSTTRPPSEETDEITVIAWGTTGEEEAKLVVNGTIQIPFDVTTSRTKYNFQVTGGVNRVEVEFLNDRSRPVDRNLIIDAIEINGTRYQTEDDNVESFGSWSKDNGCGPGFKEVEVLHCNGRFVYEVVETPGQTTTTTTAPTPSTTAPTTLPSTTTPPTTSPSTTTTPSTTPSTTTPPSEDSDTVTVIAWGTTGEERAQLVINDDFTISFDVSTKRTKYNFTSAEDIETVRVEFLNDRARPVDRNLIVDAIEVNGTRYQSEDSNVESLGAWTVTNGCGPGFKQTEVLHCNGHFTFLIPG